jgi:hypothetical protein
MSAGHIVVINDASIAKGGATSLALLSVRLLHEQGVRVTYIAGDDGENSALHDLDINVVAVGGTHLVAQSKAKSLLGGIHNPSTVDRLTQWIKENDKPDTVYHVHGWSKILSPSLFAALGSVAARTVVHAHDFFMACPNGGMMNYKTMELCQKTPMSIDCILTNCDKRSYPQKLWRVARQRSLRRKVSPPGPWAQILMIHEKMLPTLVSAG